MPTSEQLRGAKMLSEEARVTDARGGGGGAAFPSGIGHGCGDPGGLWAPEGFALSLG